jgi:Arc/MetJ family transcription regulator
MGCMTADHGSQNSQQTRCVCDVYDAHMARTNIDIDEDAVRRVMERYGFATMKEAVNYALNRLAPRRATREEILAMRGSGWDGDLEQMRGQK